MHEQIVKHVNSIDEVLAESLRMQMEKGYQEMAELNLKICNEMNHLSSEAMHTTEEFLK